MAPNRVRVPALLAASLMLACTSIRTGSKVSPDGVGELQRGVTSQTEVRLRFGPPTSMRMRSDGSSTWRYVYEEIQARDTGTVTRLLCTVGLLIRIPACLLPTLGYRAERITRDELTIRFDDAQVILSYSYLHEEVPVSGVYDPVVRAPGRFPRTGRRSPIGPTRGPGAVPSAIHEASRLPTLARSPLGEPRLF